MMNYHDQVMFYGELVFSIAIQIWCNYLLQTWQIEEQKLVDQLGLWDIQPALARRSAKGVYKRSLVDDRLNVLHVDAIARVHKRV